MFHSAEIRWFIEGDVPDEIRDWFLQSGLAIDEEPRVDEYLVLPGSTATGVKFRQYPGDDRASFEVKTRTSDPIPLDAGSAQGMMDAWVKWSCRPQEPTSFRDSITAGEDRWIYVAKRRCLRKFSLDSSQPIEVNPRTDRPAEGCQFELTAISASMDKDGLSNRDIAERWWSLSYEAFGSTGDLFEYVRATSECTLSDWTVTGLDLPDTSSYPAWLLEMADRYAQGA